MQTTTDTCNEEISLYGQRTAYPARQPKRLLKFGIVRLAGIPQSASLEITYPAQHFDYKDHVGA